MEKNYKLYHGDCLEKLKELEDNSIDSIVTDPPYGLAFMGKKWDYDVPSQQIWEECMRVLKPGGHLLAFAGSRTYHRMAVRIEDAGFDIRDQIMWVYGSGFPKSHNIGHKVDEYKGWGTALKPAHEPIVMARKPFKGSVAENVLEWGTGGINVDGCRISTSDNLNGGGYGGNNVGVATYALSDGRKTLPTNKLTKDDFIQPEGRFPANFILECTCDNPIVKENTNQPYTYKDKNYSEKGFLPNVNAVAPYNYNDTNSGVVHTDPNCPCYILDKQSGKLNKQAKCKTDNKSGWQNDYVGGNGVNAVERKLYLDEGGASRFFYCPKANKSDRNEGINNNHPTVKPTELMTYLIRLVTPKGGIVLDPFMGSGSTGKACIREGFGFVGIEREEEYLQIAEQRIEWEYNKQHPHNWF